MASQVITFSQEEAEAKLAEIPGWVIYSGKLSRRLRFRDFHEVMAFVNGLAVIINMQDHHPEMVITYNEVGLVWDTHSPRGLTEKDFTCARLTTELYNKFATK